MLLCPECGKEHPKLPHPYKPGRVVIYCGNRAVLETWGSFSEASLEVFADLGSETAKKIIDLGAKTVGDIQDLLFPPNLSTCGEASLVNIPGVGVGVNVLISYFMQDALKVLVTGTGRCGTRYFSKRLTSAGIPCHHELIGLTGLRGLKDRVQKFNVVADSSWLAAAYLQHIPEEVTIVHLVRHPAKVIESLMRMRFFYRGNLFQRYTDFATGSLPGIGSFSRVLDRAIYFYLQWNAKIVYNSRGQRILHRIEDNDHSLLHKLGTTRFRGLFSDVTDNHRTGKPYAIEWGKVDSGLWRELDQYSEELGYNLGEEYVA